ncbi:MAG: hypothetical protein IKQ27_16075 [Lachnospiraceae bacterium]|nr:hypothetical protein [Lachnospiraceae bacterium]
MIVVYTQDATYIKKDADAAKDVLLSVYGEKLGAEAYAAVKNGREGTTYRVHGGPRVEIVSKEKAEWIKEKETAIGMM